MGSVILFIIAMLFAIPITIWQGYVFSIMWGWFVVPTFDVQQLPVAVAIGLMMTASMLMFRYRSRGESSDAECMTKILVAGAVKPSLCLALGFVVRQFVP